MAEMNCSWVPLGCRGWWGDLCKHLHFDLEPAHCKPSKTLLPLLILTSTSPISAHPCSARTRPKQRQASQPLPSPYHRRALKFALLPANISLIGLHTYCSQFQTTHEYHSGSSHLFTSHWPSPLSSGSPVIQPRCPHCEAVCMQPWDLNHTGLLPIVPYLHCGVSHKTLDSSSY